MTNTPNPPQLKKTLATISRSIPKWVLDNRLDLKDAQDLFTPFKSDKDKQISTDHQRGQLKELLKMPSNELVCISGTLTDTLPRLMAASILAHLYTKQGLGVYWVPVYSSIHFEDTLSSYEFEKVKAVVISNILPDSSISRIEKVKDLISQLRDMNKLAIIVTAGIEPYCFCVTRLRTAPNYAFHIKSSS